MSKLDVYQRAWGCRYIFFCPGCQCGHSVDVRIDGQEPSWQFNDSLDHPTFLPSVKYSQCHFFIENGKIRYLDDCTHSLANQTVDMEVVNDEESYLFE